MSMYRFAGMFSVLLLCFASFVHGNCFADEPSCACKNNNINYTGDYIVGYNVILEYIEGEGVNEVRDDESTFRILPGSEGGSSISYVMKKHVDGDGQDQQTKAGLETVDAVANLSVDRMCVAPPHSGAGLECVDIEDAGITNLRPLQVDDDCNMLVGWATYIEPKTPGCNSNLCAPVVYEATYTRLGFSPQGDDVDDDE